MSKRKKHFTTKNTHLKNGNNFRKFNVIENQSYNPFSDIQSMVIKRKIGITVVLNNNNNTQIKSFIGEYDDMFLLNRDFEKIGKPLDLIDGVLRTKDMTQKLKEELLPKLVMSYIPKTKGFDFINKININGDWNEFGIVLSFTLLDKGIFVDKSIPMKFKDWKNYNKSIHKGNWNEFENIERQQYN